ncbi:hypothetical protein ACFLUT_01225 [Chloroflexota bacterium]
MPTLEWRVDGTPCRQISRHVGKCIYCGATESLSREHIVPYGLGGGPQLRKGSCEACSTITGRFEQVVLRGQFLLMRARASLPTRDPDNRPKSFVFEVMKDGRSEAIELPTDECPISFIMPLFQSPRYLEEYDYKSGMAMIGLTGHGSRSDLKRLGHDLGIESISYKDEQLGNNFGRLLAKIAYGFAVFEYGLGAFEECYVLPCILGVKDDAGYWVGNSERPVVSLPKERDLHRMQVGKRGNEVHSLIRLFARFQTPEYRVVVGRLK